MHTLLNALVFETLHRHSFTSMQEARTLKNMCINYIFKYICVYIWFIYVYIFLYICVHTHSAKILWDGSFSFNSIFSSLWPSKCGFTNMEVGECLVFLDNIYPDNIFYFLCRPLLCIMSSTLTILPFKEMLIIYWF